LGIVLACGGTSDFTTDEKPRVCLENHLYFVKDDKASNTLFLILFSLPTAKKSSASTSARDNPRLHKFIAASKTA